MKSFLPVLILLAAFPSAVLAQAPAGAEFQVNTYTTNAQYAAEVASDASGNFVVVWASNGQDGSDFGIFGQRFSASGLPQGSEFQVNTYTTNKQYFPAVASDPNGNFAVVWESYGPDGSARGIFAQRFNPLGVPQGPEFRVNSYTPYAQSRPAVASDSSGNFVVVWQSDFQDGAAIGVHGQRFNAAGVARGSEFRVNSYTPGFQLEAAVASDPGGNFLVVWTSLTHPQDGNGAAVVGQRYNATGVPQGIEFRINSYTTGGQVQPKVSADANGNFVVVWSSTGQDGNGTGIFGQRLDSSGALQGSEFPVNSFTTSVQAHAAVSSDANGNFAVVWHSFQDGSSYGIFGQRFDASGAPQGSEFRVNSYTMSYQMGPGIASDANGNFVVVWNSTGQDGNGTGIFGQRYGDLIFEDGFEPSAFNESISCNWTNARWLSHGWDGGAHQATGAWFSCISGRLSYVQWVQTAAPGVTPVPAGTDDQLVGCDWGNATRWASEGFDINLAFTRGATVWCDGTRATSMAWEDTGWHRLGRNRATGLQLERRDLHLPRVGLHLCVPDRFQHHLPIRPYHAFPMGRISILPARAPVTTD